LPGSSLGLQQCVIAGKVLATEDAAGKSAVYSDAKSN